MAGKRYYWLKLQVGFFQELIIKQLRTLPEGDSIRPALFETAVKGN